MTAREQKTAMDWDALDDMDERRDDLIATAIEEAVKAERERWETPVADLLNKIRWWALQEDGIPEEVSAEYDVLYAMQGLTAAIREEQE